MDDIEHLAKTNGHTKNLTNGHVNGTKGTTNGITNGLINNTNGHTDIEGLKMSLAKQIENKMANGHVHHQAEKMDKPEKVIEEKQSVTKADDEASLQKLTKEVSYI